MASEMVGLLVPTEQIAKVIGKAGAGLKQIRETTGVKMQVHQSTDAENGARRVDLIGQTESICAAFQLLLNKAFADSSNCAPVLHIPASKAGQVVGKGGDNLKRVREECRVRLNLERESVTDAATGTQERLLTMSGEPSQMARALRYVLGSSTLPQLPAALTLPPLNAALPQAMSRPRPPLSPDEMQLQMTIPDQYVGAILGKGGALMKSTAATAGCRVTMSARGQGPERRAVIIGTFSQCLVAQGLLHQQLTEAYRGDEQELNEITVLFLVRKEAAGAVVGKAGATLKTIRESSGVKIKLAREEIEGQRPCTLIGSLQSVTTAENAIHELIKEVPAAGEETGNAYSSVANFPATPYASNSSFDPYDGSMHKRADTSVHAAPTAKRQRVDDPEPTTKLLVPAHSAGAVIGRQGSGLKEVRESTGAHVDMLQQVQAPHWPQDRVVILKGPAAARHAAVLAVLRMAFSTNQENCVLKLLVSGTQAGAVIGKQGSTLKYIREQSGTSVQVDREEVLGDRLVTAAGAFSVVSAAAMAICGVLEEDQAEASPSPSSIANAPCEEHGSLPSPGAYVQ